MDIAETLANLPQEGELPEAPVTETPTVTPAAENQPEKVVEKPAEEGDNTPTEEDNDYKERTSKRVQQLLKERAEERQQREALEERLARLEQQGTPQSEEIPERWSKLFSTGDPEQDQLAYQEWKALNQEERAAMKAELIAEMKAEESKEAEEQEQFAATYETLMDELEADGKEFDRNALMKFMTEIPGGLWTTDGKPNFALGLELMEARKTPSVKAQVKKSLGSLHTPGGTGQKEYFTPEDFAGFR